MVEVRRAQRPDFPAVARLLYASAADMYNRFAGGESRALAVLERSLAVPGTASSADVVWLAQLDGTVAGAMAAFPVAESASRSRAFLRLALRAAPPTRWPASLLLYWGGGRASPAPPGSSLYVDALATDPALRRRGVARALLAEAEREARARRLPAVTLDTTVGNQAARTLYSRAGFDEIGYRPAGRSVPGFVALVKRLR